MLNKQIWLGLSKNGFSLVPMTPPLAFIRAVTRPNLLAHREAYPKPDMGYHD